MQVEITLQPWHAFKPDGVVLFSDILTPLAGMNIGFDFNSKGPVIADPIRTMEVRKGVITVWDDSVKWGGNDMGSSATACHC